MSNDQLTGGVIAIFFTIGHIAVWACSGIYAWDWVEPESFQGAILFLVLWGIMGYLFQQVMVFIIGIILSMLGQL